MKVYLNKSLIKQLDTNSLLVYIALKSIYHKGEEEIYVSLNMLCYRLYGNVNYTRTFKDNISNGFDILCTKEIIRVKEQINKTEFVIDVSALYFENEYFIGIDLEHIRNCCNCNLRIDRGSLVKYLVTMLGTLCNDPSKYCNSSFDGKQGFVGFMPISYIAKEAEVTEQTALSYNKILEDNKIIFVYRHGNFYQDSDGNLKTVNNNYGLFEDKEDIIKFGDNFDEMNGFESKTSIEKRERANHRRSLAAKYINICKGAQYSEEETKEICEYIHNRNKVEGVS